MPALSVVLITKNAAQTLAICLANISACLASAPDQHNEILVLDSGSTDATNEICARFGARVIQTDWPGFGPQKNRAVSAAKNDWVLCLDADEYLTPALSASIQSALSAATPAFSAYRFARCNQFLGRYLKHGEGYPDWSLRLFDRRVARWSDDLVHEKVLCNTPVGTLCGDLLHDSAESLHSYLDKQNHYTSLAAQAYIDSTGTQRRISNARILFSPLVRFTKFYVLRGGFKDGLPGFIHIAIGCFNSFMKYAKIREWQWKNRH